MKCTHCGNPDCECAGVAGSIEEPVYWCDCCGSLFDYCDWLAVPKRDALLAAAKVLRHAIATAEKMGIQEAVQRQMKVIPMIDEVKRHHAGKDWQGKVSCPVCHGVLNLSHAAYNGHVWGRCETEGCLAWME